MRHDDTLHSIIYFTALAGWRSVDAVNRHQALINANAVKGVKSVLGKFKKKYIHCPKCNRSFERHEEKATDVNIALYAYRLAATSKVEQVVLVTGDTDLIPAINMIKEDFPSISVGVIFPYNRFNHELKNTTHFHHTTSEKILSNFRLSNKIVKSNGKIITCPPNWQ